ncbi:fungal-specific transcription factor domain-containing protein [Lipomyces arxii]|uniref:fungal-specific transcription factor domain-containing protein n=1 Tax=Lipomyces arxii TaxID=56418 RepID=UPI0034CD680B
MNQCSDSNQYTSDSSNLKGASIERAAESKRLDRNTPNIPLSKRIACAICRKRKLKCDGNRPTCGTCFRRQHDCVYEETRRKSGPKRGYVKMLEERLAHVEGLLSASVSQSESSTSASNHSQVSGLSPTLSSLGQGSGLISENPLVGLPQTVSPQQRTLPESFQLFNLEDNGVDMFGIPSLPGGDSENFFELISLGMEEQLPPKEITDELTESYFNSFHKSYPMLHKPRFMLALNSNCPQLQPPLYLRYAVWAMGASCMPKHIDYAHICYVRARKYLEYQQMRSHGEYMKALAFVQAWVIISLYEYRAMFLPRAWISVGTACRLALMMQLHIIDSPEAHREKYSSPELEGFVDIEECRRTFWVVFCADRYASTGTGWPLNIEEVNIEINLPSSEDAFYAGREEETCMISTALTAAGSKIVKNLSVYAIHIIVVGLFGRIHHHLHWHEIKHDSMCIVAESTSKFLERFRHLDNSLHSVMLSLPNELKRSTGPASASAIQVGMAIHAATICLHHATIYRTRHSPQYSKDFEASRRRCLHAASEITFLMQSCSHIDVNLFDAFMSFCVYIAAQCFIQAIKYSPEDVDGSTMDYIDFLINVLDNMKNGIFIAQSFFLQLEFDRDHMDNFDKPISEDLAARDPGSGCSMTPRSEGLSETGSFMSQNAMEGLKPDADEQKDYCGLSPSGISHIPYNPKFFKQNLTDKSSLSVDNLAVDMDLNSSILLESSVSGHNKEPRTTGSTPSMSSGSDSSRYDNTGTANTNAMTTAQQKEEDLTLFEKSVEWDILVKQRKLPPDLDHLPWQDQILSSMSEGKSSQELRRLQQLREQFGNGGSQQDTAMTGVSDEQLISAAQWMPSDFMIDGTLDTFLGPTINRNAL